MNEKGNTLPENKEKGKKEWTPRMILRILKSPILATIVSVVAALISVFAIQSSINIAENQNRISLFEKRYEIYQTYKALNINAKKANEVLRTQEIGKNIEVWIAFVAYIVPENSILDMDAFKTGGIASGSEAAEVYLQVSKDINEYCVKIESAKYIFNLSESEKREIDTVLEEFQAITYEKINNQGYNNLKAKMIQLAKELSNLSMIKTMEDQLKVK